MPSRMASSVMLATVWRCSGTMPMLGASLVDDRATACLAAGRADGALLGGSERGIDGGSGCDEASSDTISGAAASHNPFTLLPRSPDEFCLAARSAQRTPRRPRARRALLCRAH